ncbi:MAG TPA: hypothetical protein VHZ07_18425 [Bryobacteraceae bacterium]|jgi:hypothetical protein|nr:hypothetical protein [Bryobacteraceae bacterium]
MGVTARSGTLAVAIAILASGASPLRANQAAEALATVNYIASALSDDNPADAMTPFEKSFPDYDKLAGYFEGLVDRALVTSSVQVVDEQDHDQSTDLTIQWTMDLSNRSMNGLTEDRTGELHVHLVKKKGKWKIASLSPISFFDPQRAASK